jgi:uncharacterized cupredoxin-like copper-binding protein
MNDTIHGALSAIAASCLLAAAPASLAHSPAHSPAHGTAQASPHAASHAASTEVVETAFGRSGDPGAVSRTIRIEMRDTMRFEPDKLTVRKGDTVRLEVVNAGAVLHELVIGTRAELDAHAEMMRKFPGMEHDEPYMAHVDPGKTGAIVWQFTQAGEFGFACLIPGHFEAGMIGHIQVTE